MEFIEVLNYDMNFFNQMQLVFRILRLVFCAVLIQGDPGLLGSVYDGGDGFYTHLYILDDVKYKKNVEEPRCALL